MTILKYLQLPFNFDAAKIREEVDLLSGSHWQQHYQVRQYEGDWSAVPLRSAGGKPGNIIISPTNDIPYEDTVFLDHSPFLKTVLQTFQCPLLAVRLLKLNANALVKEHRDADLNFEKGEIRLHIPVTTHEEVEFYLDNERMDLKEGECWYMNFNLPHRINNKSSINRVHLVIDALVNDWVKEQFSRNDIPCKKEVEDLSNTHSDETKKQMIRQFREMNTSISNQIADQLEKELLH